MMVWTKDTGIFEIAVALRRWPARENIASGRVVIMISRDGDLMPCFNAGTAVFSHGKTDAKYADTRHQRETNANCITVKVTGFLYAVRMDLDEVFVSADVMYQTIQRAYTRC